MTLKVSTTVTKVARPNEKLFSGYGLSARGSVVPAGYTGVGAAVLTSGPTTVEKYGLPTKLDAVLHFHFRLLRNNTTGEVTGTGWLSVGPVCDSSADPSLASVALNWIADNEFFSVAVKKRTGGTIGNFLVDQAATPLGNYIKIFEDAVQPTQFTEFYNEVKTYYGPLFSENKVLKTTIGQLRECDIYLNPQVDDVLSVSWTGAYMPDVNEETLWLQDDKGNLLTEIRIYEDQIEGTRNFPLEGGKFYKLVIPGYSYRNYSLTFEQSMKWMLEPVKVHFLGTLGGEGRFYIKVLAGESATFCMKDYNRGAIESPFGATLTKVSDPNVVLDLNTDIKQYFYQYDTVAIPTAATDEFWRIDLKGKGRAAFWLDGVPNLFSESVSSYYRPVINANSVTVDTPSFNPVTSIGKIPRLGHYMDYTVIPNEYVSLLQSLNGETGHIYTFFNPMTTNPNFENVFREDMLSKFTFDRDYTIFDAGTRETLFKYGVTPNCATGLSAFIDNMYRLRTYGGEHYLSSVDEPNLGQPDYTWFREHYIAFAEAVRANPKSAPANIKLAVPASSRFDHGVESKAVGNNGKKGLDWAKQIIEERPDLVDAIVWHDWTVHGLLNLRQYGKAIEEAYKLSNNGARKLCIEQTNTGGGSSVSLYQANTNYMTLWWAGIFAVCANTGKLDDLCYFLLVDDPTHPKGLLFTDENAAPGLVYTKKNVAFFQSWLGSHLKGTTDRKAYAMANPMIELELCAWTNVKASVTRKFIMGVNKSARAYTVNLDQFNWGTSGVKCEIFKPDGTTEVISPTIDVVNNKCTFTLAAETVFLLSQGVV